MTKSGLKFFNCSKQKEHDYVANLYPSHQHKKIKSQLEFLCKHKLIYYSTYEEIYNLIENTIGLKRTGF